ncbi:uncharacterized protein LOC135398125 [Ornithodoros turicata]|uniref:uncharacterized protein LOC135398125 n=1 Tax=Ornithodoros turicata TaxID=34597 RepID=UPI0031395E15
MPTISTFHHLSLIALFASINAQWQYMPVVISTTEVGIRWTSLGRQQPASNTANQFVIQSCTVNTGCIEACRADEVNAAQRKHTVHVDLHSRRLLIRVFHQTIKPKSPDFEHEFAQTPEEPNPPCNVTWSRDAYGGALVSWDPALGPVEGYEVRLCNSKNLGSVPGSALASKFYPGGMKVECDVGCPGVKPIVTSENYTQAYLTDIYPFVGLAIEVRSFRKDQRRVVHHSVPSANVHSDRLSRDLLVSIASTASFLLLGNPLGFLVVICGVGGLVAVFRWLRYGQCGPKPSLDISQLVLKAEGSTDLKRDMAASPPKTKTKPKLAHPLTKSSTATASK